MTKFKVLMTSTTIPEIGLRLLKTECDVVVSEGNKNVILQNIEGVDALFWWSKLKLDKEILDKADQKISFDTRPEDHQMAFLQRYTSEQNTCRQLKPSSSVSSDQKSKCPKLRVIGTMSAGYDNIDVEEIKKRGIKFGNTPNVLNDAVADTAVLLTLAASRRFTEGRQAIERCLWKHESGAQWLLGQDITGSTVGIVGLGGIGLAIAKRLKCFNVAKFVYTGHREKPEGKIFGAEFVSLDELLKISDFVIASVPLTKETDQMFNAEAFAKMKKTAVFVNISRGGIVNQPDLIVALKQNKIFAAGLDVMTPEPLPSDHELLKLPNCVLMPHLGSATEKTRSKMAELTANNILKALNGEPMLAPVV